MIASSELDLPAPFGPTSPTSSPGATSSEMPRTAGTPRYRTSSPSTASAGVSDIRELPLLAPAAPAEVGVGDVDVAPDLLGSALCERASLVEDVDAVAHV